MRPPILRRGGGGLWSSIEHRDEAPPILRRGGGLWSSIEHRDEAPPILRRGGGTIERALWWQVGTVKDMVMRGTVDRNTARQKVKRIGSFHCRQVHKIMILICPPLRHFKCVNMFFIIQVEDRP